MKKVVILQHRLLHYRTKLFEQLREACSNRGIELELVHGQASRREQVKNDEGSLAWAYRVFNRFMEISERDIVWQPYPAELNDADLVVLMQESRILSNYPLLLSRLWSHRKVAYWGHGKNFQSDAPSGLREQWKNLLLRRVDWWFAYTQTTVDILKVAGYAQDQITCLDNAIDNQGFIQDLASVTEETLTDLRKEICAGPNSKIGLFCGSLYGDKKLEFMVAAADQIHAAMPNFRLVVIGDGPSAGQMREFANSRPWLTMVGVRKGAEKAAYFKLAEVVFNPGAVGLHVLDAFCAGIPMATTVDARHGPEFAYLEDGVNGIATTGNAQNYADRIIRLMDDKQEYERLCAGAVKGAKRYTLQNMVDSFTDGIEKCLASPR